MLKSQKYYASALLIVTIGFGIYLVKDLHLINDIYWADEGLYLYNGRLFFKQQVDPVWGPVYSLWYYLLNKIEPDPINLYYLNFKVLIVCTSLALFIFLRTARVNLSISFLFSVMLLISYYNFNVWPKIAHFTFITTLILFSFIIRKKNKSTILTESLISSLILSYIRPEFFLSFILILLYFFIDFFINRKEKIISKSKTALLVIIAASTLFFIWGIPYSDNRSFGAFSQHYSLTKYYEQTERNADPWLESRNFLEKDFGNAKNLFEVVLNNPAMFFQHLTINSFVYLKSSINIFTELIIPNTVIYLSTEARIFIVATLLSLLFYIKFVRKKIREFLKEIADSYKHNKITVLIALILLLPFIISSLINYPRDHYLFIQYPLYLVILLPVIRILNFNNKLSESILISLVIVFASLYLFSRSHYKPETKSKLTDEVRFIQKFNKTNELKFLNRSSNLTFFLPLNFQNVELDTLDIENDLSQIFKYDFIYINNRLKSSPKLRGSDLNNLISEAKSIDFNVFITPGNNILLVKN